MKLFWKTAIILIFLTAVFLRTFKLDSVPPALFGDEIDVGYQAYSILHTGRDLNGRFLPVYIKSLSEYRAPLYIYSAIPFVGLFGLNEWGVRFAAVFWGVVSIAGILLLGNKLFNLKTGIFAAFMLTISPWHIQYSRASFEATMLLSFLIFGTYFFIRGIEEFKYLVFSAAVFGLSVYIYSTAVVFTPLFLLIILGIYHKRILKIPKAKMTVVLGVFIFTLLPNIWFVYKGEAKERFSLVSIFQQTILEDKINLAVRSQEFYSPEGEVRQNDPKLEKIFHNKPTVYAQVFITNYMRSFAPDFLFSNGDINFRHSIHEMGEMYYFEIIFLAFGLWVLFSKEELKKRLLLGSWLLIAPIPSSLTADGGYHATRLILMLPPLAVLVGLGWSYLFEKRGRLFSIGSFGIIAFLFLFNFTFYLHRYYVHYPVESWRWWHVGFKEAMEFMRENEGGYEKLVFNNTYEPSLIRFLFFWGYPPEKFQKQYDPLKLDQLNILDGFAGNSIDNKYYFGKVIKEKGVSDFVDPEWMYLVSARDEVEGDWDWSKSGPETIKVLKTIRNPYGEPLFYIVTGTK